MAVVIRETLPSRETSNRDGKLVTQRDFVIYDNATASNLATPQSVIDLFGTTSSVTGETLPTYFDEMPGFTDIRAVDYDGPRIDEAGLYHWRLTWHYLRVAGTNPTVSNPAEPGYWEYNYSATATVEPGYRDNPGLVFPTNGTPVTSGTIPDVGGISIDSSGEPGDLLKLQQHLDITEVVAGQYTPAASFTFLKKRNNATFMGANPGRLVYAGLVASNRVDTGIFSITHRLIWDEFYHMQQRVVRGPDGEPYRKSAGAGISLEGDWVAEYVKWYQPCPTLSNFNSISSNWP